VNGSGYPRGLKGNEIHEYAQIVGMCDVFDAMNSARPHRPGYLPHDTLEYLMGAGSTLFDFSLVTLFVKNVAIYPLGLTVKLNSGETAVIVDINPEYPQRPLVRLISRPDGSPVDTPMDLDLTKHTTIMITGLDT
jgi:HD-GYP domain-containing protein (c-di-GMP phosphodiesterase class II)